MFTLTLDERHHGVLISLASVLERMPCANVAFWRFRDISVNNGVLFGLPAPQFEEKSRLLPGGVCVSSEAFTSFTHSSVQIVDGVIEGLQDADATKPLFTLECVDAGRWEIMTEDQIMALELERRGWLRQ